MRTVEEKEGTENGYNPKFNPIVDFGGNNQGTKI